MHIRYTYKNAVTFLQKIDVLYYKIKQSTKNETEKVERKKSPESDCINNKVRMNADQKHCAAVR